MCCKGRAPFAWEGRSKKNLRQGIHVRGRSSDPFVPRSLRRGHGRSSRSAQNEACGVAGQIFRAAHGRHQVALNEIQTHQQGRCQGGREVKVYLCGPGCIGEYIQDVYMCPYVCIHILCIGMHECMYTYMYVYSHLSICTCRIMHMCVYI